MDHVHEYQLHNSVISRPRPGQTPRERKDLLRFCTGCGETWVLNRNRSWSLVTFNDDGEGSDESEE